MAALPRDRFDTFGPGFCTEGTVQLLLGEGGLQGGGGALLGRDLADWWTGRLCCAAYMGWAPSALLPQQFPAATPRADHSSFGCALVSRSRRA